VARDGLREVSEIAHELHRLSTSDTSDVPRRSST
jgi:hypothetical protein